MIGLQTPQEVEMPVPPQNDVVIVVAGCHRAADNQKQHLAERIHHLAWLAIVLDRRKMLQKALAARRSNFAHGFLRICGSLLNHAILRRATKYTPSLT